MTLFIKVGVTVATFFVAAAAGLWAGQSGVIKIPSPTTTAMNAVQVNASGPVIYYRDPAGKPFYSPVPKSTATGEPYLEVHASEDVSFEAPKDKAAASTERRVKFYRNPMGLSDTSPTPKKDPMGMDYIAVYEGEESDSSIKLSPGKVQLTGVETVSVGKHPIIRTIKAPGTVQIDERRVAVIAPRFDGYVVKVGAATTGTHVMKGEVLARVFGQEVLNQAARLLVEQDNPAVRGENPSFGTVSGPGGLIGAKRRLQNLGVPDDFIAQVEHVRRVPDTFEYRSPIDGDVLERKWSDGQGFKAGDVGFRIVDHSVVWMMADVAESDIAAVRPGERVKVTTRAHPGREFEGKVTVVYPHLMKETRTAQVRIELPNLDMALLPDMYGDVEIATGTETSVVAVPASALIDSGSRRVVLLDLGDGRFEPREIKPGRRGDGFVEVLSGVREGDQVVVNGNFLIDAESNLRAALKSLAAPSATETTQ